MGLQCLPIKGYEEKYLIYDNGTVWSIDRKTYLTPKVRSGYHSVLLSQKGVRKNFLIHRLVAKAFLTPKEGEEQVNHKDEDKFNNRVSNLEWCTPSYNQSYSKSKQDYLIWHAESQTLRIVRNVGKACRDFGINPSAFWRSSARQVHTRTGWVVTCL